MLPPKPMWAFTTRFSGRTNVLFCEVKISPAYNADLGLPAPRLTETRAIWDTGASCTVISKQLAQQIGLIPTGKTQVHGVNNISVESTYLVNIYLPNKVCIPYIKIVEVPMITGNSGLLIGMDIIGSGDFSVYLEENKTVMSYRLPSRGGIDYVREIDKDKLRQQAMRGHMPAENFGSKTHHSKLELKRKRKQERQNRKKNKRR